MDKQQAHQLLDRLEPAQFDVVAKLLEVMIREDDGEGVTAEDRRAIAASREYFRQMPDGGIPFETMLAACGFTLEEIRNHRDD